jgi:hypothetical protein
MGKSKNRPNQKKKAAARSQQIQAKRRTVQKLVGELEQEFAKLQAPVPTFTSAPGSGTFLTSTPITHDYDNMEI